MTGSGVELVYNDVANVTTTSSRATEEWMPNVTVDSNHNNNTGAPQKSVAVDEASDVESNKTTPGERYIVRGANTNGADNSIDNNYYDTSYWLLDFLDVVHVQDDFYHTSNYLEMVDNFTKEVLAPKMDKAEQIQFMNDSVDYFAKHETFNFDEFCL